VAEKVKYAFRMEPQLQEEIKEWFPKDNCRSQNEFIEKAIRFYLGYLAGQVAANYLPAALVAALRTTVQGSEEHICRMLFKLSVENSILMNVVAAGMDIDEESLTRLRGKCVEQVKKSNGCIRFKDAVEYQKGRR